MSFGHCDAAVPQALILAAGVGKRLSAMGKDAHRGPKALLDFDGKTLLQRHIELLRQSGINTITVIAGFEADSVRTALEALPSGPPVCVLINPAFREGSVVSLWAGRSVLESGAPVILMDADVIYDYRLMTRLVESSKSNVLLLDREIEPGDEPVKLCVRNGQIVDFRKKPTEAHEWYGESVGFFRFTPDAAAELARRTGDYVANGRRTMEYEEPIRDMIMASPADRFGFEDISGLPWTEIDFPEDVVKAHALLPELVS
jgi:choline kinase